MDALSNLHAAVTRVLPELTLIVAGFWDIR